MSLTLSTQVSQIRPLYDYLKKQRENRKFVKYVEISATFILITFFLVFALRPAIITISTLRGDIESKKLIREELHSKIDKVILAQDLFSQVQERYQVVNSSLPDRPNYYDAATIIQQIGQKYEISPESLSFNLDTVTLEEQPNIRTYTVSIGVNGPFSNAANLASEVLKNRRTDYISSINFVGNNTQNSGSTAPTSASSVATKFSTTFYYWPNTDEKK